MRRRTLLRRIAAGTALTVGGVGSGAAVDPESIRLNWEFSDGRTEEMTLAAFDERSDTPDRAAMRARGESIRASVCCDCPLRGPDCEECSGGCGTERLA